MIVSLKNSSGKLYSYKGLLAILTLEEISDITIKTNVFGKQGPIIPSAVWDIPENKNRDGKSYVLVGWRTFSDQWCQKRQRRYLVPPPYLI